MHNLNSCIRCGSCAAQCPTYRESATEGMSARGRLALLKGYMEGEIKPSGTLDQRIFSCMLCGACSTLCPLGITVTDAMYAARKRLRGLDRKRRLVGFGARVGFKRAREVYRVLRFFQNMGDIFFPGGGHPLRAFREMGIVFPPSSLKAGEFLYRVPHAKGRIALLAGCTVNYLYPFMGRSLIRSLNAMKYDVILPKGEACCGAPLLSLGLEEEAAHLAERNIQTYRSLQIEAVISLCPTCVHFVREEYRKLIGAGIDNVLDVTEFLSDKPLWMNDLRSQEAVSASRDGAGAERSPRVVYHDPCHSLYHLKVSREPREILRSLGFNLVEPKGRGCCGFAGTFRVLYQGLSEGILNRRIEDYAQADMIVTSCPNCVFQLRSKMKDKPVRHIIEVVEEGMVISS